MGIGPYIGKEEIKEQGEPGTRPGGILIENRPCGRKND
jgi:hypothetical protein